MRQILAFSTYACVLRFPLFRVSVLIPCEKHLYQTPVIGYHNFCLFCPLFCLSLAMVLVLFRSFARTEQLLCVYEPQQIRVRLLQRKTGLCSPLPQPSKLLLTVPRRCFCYGSFYLMVYLNLLVAGYNIYSFVVFLLLRVFYNICK